MLCYVIQNRFQIETKTKPIVNFENAGPFKKWDGGLKVTNPPMWDITLFLIFYLLQFPSNTPTKIIFSICSYL